MENTEVKEAFRNLDLLETEDYRQAMTVCFNFYKNQIRPITRSRVAEKMGVHSSLLTNVFKERADLTSDQIYLFAKALKLTAPETRFLQMLWEKDRTALQEKRDHLQVDIEKFRTKYLSVSSQISHGEPLISQDGLAFYWTTPLAQIVVLALSIKKFSQSPEQLLDELGISREEFQQCFDSLLEYQIIYEDKGRFHSTLGNYHLPKESPFCPSQNKMMRLASLHQSDRLPSEKNYQLAVTFTANQNTFAKIQKEIVAAVKKAQESVAQTQRHSQVYQLNIDLFPWTR